MKQIIGKIVLTGLFAYLVIYLYITLCIVPGLQSFPEQLKIFSIMKTNQHKT